MRELAGLGQHQIKVNQSVGQSLPLVAIGRGLTLVSEAWLVCWFPGVAYRPISNEDLPFSAVWSASSDNPAFGRFLSMAEAMAVRPCAVDVAWSELSRRRSVEMNLSSMGDGASRDRRRATVSSRPGFPGIGQGCR